MSECSDSTISAMDECVRKAPGREGCEVGPECSDTGSNNAGESPSRRHSDPAGGKIAKVRADSQKCPEELRDRRVSIKGLFLMREYTPGALGNVSGSSLLQRRIGNGNTPKGSSADAANHFA